MMNLALIRPAALLILAGLLLAPATPAGAHYKARYHVILDTDGGIDDFRAICLMLANPEIEVIAITCTAGVLTAGSSWQKVASLLHHFGHEGIPVGRGAPDLHQIPEFRELAESLHWCSGGPSGLQAAYEGIPLIHEAASLEEMPVDYVALGPLTSLAGALQKYPGLDTAFRKIYWFNGSLDTSGFNYRFDPFSAGYVMDSGIPLDVVGAQILPVIRPDRLLKPTGPPGSRYAAAVAAFYRDHGNSVTGHFMGLHLGDDLVALYLSFPELFSCRDISSGSHIRNLTASPNAGLDESYVSLLDAEREDKSIIFRTFPVDPRLFEEDISILAADIIRRHGLREWKVVVLTNEFHEHLGVYSVVGAKMGLRAREFFRLGIDELVITSHAGERPPLSCLNDGLQASTGATLGHGTITVSPFYYEAEALFNFKDQTISLSLKPEIRERIRQDIRKGIERYGFQTENYWVHVREIALHYWLELDRKDIFVISRI